MTANAQAGAGDLDDVQKFTRTVAAGEFVFRAGDAGDELFIVQDGRVDLLGADDVVVESIGPGGVFGEWSFFEGRPQDVSARAALDARVIHLDRAVFERITAEAPQIGASIARQLARRAAAAREAARAAQVPQPQVAPRGEPTLVAEGGRQVFRLAGFDEALVGRPDRASGTVPEIDLSPLDEQRTLSRRHAKIIRRGGALFVREEPGVRNGTFVNGERLGAGQEVELRDGDLVQFGFVKLELRWQ